MSPDAIAEIQTLDASIKFLEESAQLTKEQMALLNGVMLQLVNTAAGGTQALDSFSSSLITAVEKEAAALRKEIDAFNNAAPHLKYIKRKERILELAKMEGVSQEAVRRQLKANQEEYDRSTGKLDEYNEEKKRQVELEKEAARALESIRTPQEEYNATLERYNELLDAGIDGFGRAEFLRLEAEAAEKFAEDMRKAAEETGFAWDSVLEGLSDSFRDTFIRAGGDLDDFLDRSEEAIKEWGLRLLFDNTLGTLFSFFGGGASAPAVPANRGGAPGSTGSGLLGSAGTVASTGSSLLRSGSTLATANAALDFGATHLIGLLNDAGLSGASSAVSSYYGSLIDTGNATSNLFGQGSTGGAALGALVNVVAGVVGAEVGNAVGEAIFSGKSAESNIGATGGAIIGSYFGAVGTLIGGALGAIVDVAAGGDGRVRLNAGGFNVRPGDELPVGGRVGDVREFDSGLLFQSYTRRVGIESSNQVLDILQDLDSALVQLSEAAGVQVDLTGRLLDGISADAGGNAPGEFFGAATFNEFGQAELDAAVNLFVQEWISAVMDQLPGRTQGILSGVTGDAEALLSAFDSAVTIGTALDFDVLQIAADQLEQAADGLPTLLETYDALTQQLVDVTAEYDGSLDALDRLSEALAIQKTAAIELAAIYLQLSEETDRLFNSTIEGIRESLLSEEELYELRRSQIAQLTGELLTVVDAEDIVRLRDEILALSNDAIGLLDEDQLRQQAPEIIQFLEEANQIAQDRFGAGLDELAARETAVTDLVDFELANRAAETTAEAANTMQSAADRMDAASARFGQWVDVLTQSQIDAISAAFAANERNGALV